MKLEIETASADPEVAAGWRDWIVMEQWPDGDVHIRYDYQTPGSEERSTWQDSGATLRERDLPAIKVWLSQLPSDERVKP